MFFSEVRGHDAHGAYFKSARKEEQPRKQGVAVEAHVQGIIRY